MHDRVHVFDEETFGTSAALSLGFSPAARAVVMFLLPLPSTQKKSMGFARCVAMWNGGFRHADLNFG